MHVLICIGLHTEMTENDTDSSEPKPEPTTDTTPATVKRERPTPEGDDLDPTRYGDWEKNGRCIDF